MQGNGSLGETSRHLDVDRNWQGQRSRSASVQKADVNNAYFRQDLWKRVDVQGGVTDVRDISATPAGRLTSASCPSAESAARRGVHPVMGQHGKGLPGHARHRVPLPGRRVEAIATVSSLLFLPKAGAQELERRTFPTGSYAIDLRIDENNERSEPIPCPYRYRGGAAQPFQWFVQAATSATITVVRSAPMMTAGESCRGGCACPNRKCISDSGGSPPQRRPTPGRGRRRAHGSARGRRRHATTRATSAGQ